MRVDCSGIGPVVEDRFLDIGKRVGELAAGLEKQRRAMAEPVAQVGAVIAAHGDREVRFLQDGLGKRAALVAADIEAFGEQVVAHIVPHDVRKIDRAGGGNLDVGARPQGVAQRVLGGQAAEDVAGAHEQHAARQAEALSRRVTNSSAAVGWMPMVASNCALVAPSFTAMATPWMISPASGPIMCAPTTAWVAWSTTSFMKVRSALSVRLSFSARNEVL